MKEESRIIIKDVIDCIPYRKFEYLIGRLEQVLRIEAEAVAPIPTIPSPSAKSIKTIAIEIKRFMLTYASRFSANKLHTFYELTPEELVVYYGMPDGFLKGYTYLSLEYKGVILDIHRHCVGIDADNVDDLDNAASILTEALEMFKRQIPV